jgi:uncharacterized phiE125 gp8 family phage protein
MALSLITAPTIEPISIEEARQHVRRGDDTSEDAVLNAFIAAARHHAEAVTGRQLLEATWEWQLDAICGSVLQIPRPPLRSITSITYLDASGVTQAWSASNYQVTTPAGPFAPSGRLAPNPSATWPLSGSGYLNAVLIRFKAGYGTVPEDVPEAIRQAMRLMIGAWFENREDLVLGDSVQALPLGALALLTPFKVYA